MVEIDEGIGRGTERNRFPVDGIGEGSGTGLYMIAEGGERTAKGRDSGIHCAACEGHGRPPPSPYSEREN